MKVLIAAPYIYIEGHKHGSRNQSGLAHMIREIADMLSDNGADVFVLTQSIFTDKLKVGNFTMIQKTAVDLIKGVKKTYLDYANKSINYEKTPLLKKLKILMYFLTGGYMESVINKLKPDIVHIHSIGLYTFPFILACIRTNTKFIVTLHGLISFSEATNTNELERKMERGYLDFAKKYNIITTVVSSGIKKRISNWQGYDSEYIKIVLNSVKPNDSISNIATYNDNIKLILCVGSLTERKNQIQVVRAFELLNNRIESNYKLYLVGDGIKRKEIEDYILEKNIQNVKCLGNMNRDAVMKLYEQASLLVMASLDEGFGLPIIEGYSKGVPAVTFADLDAVYDVYSCDTMIKIQERTDMALSEGIERALNKKWDKNKIIEYSNKFSPEKIGKEYYNILNTCAQNNIDYKNFEKMNDNIFSR